jgi:hypothetical protein
MGALCATAAILYITCFWLGLLLLCWQNGRPCFRIPLVSTGRCDALPVHLHARVTFAVQHRQAAGKLIRSYVCIMASSGYVRPASVLWLSTDVAFCARPLRFTSVHCTQSTSKSIIS